MSSTGTSFYARPATSSTELADTPLWRCDVVPVDDVAIGQAPPGATPALHRRRFELRGCEQLRGPSGAAPSNLVGFTLLAPSQRSAAPTEPLLSLDGQEVFDRPAVERVLLWAGGPPLVPATGFEGHAASVSVDGREVPARVLALGGADTALADGWRALAGWTTEAPAGDAHPLVVLDHLRAALARGDRATATRLLERLDTESQLPAVRAAARDAAAERPAR